MQRHDKRICPLAREIGGEGGVGVWGVEEGQDKPILPLHLVLELRGLLEEKLLRLVIAAALKHSKKNKAHTSIHATAWEHRLCIMNTLTTTFTTQ